ncbi:unnamed protein product [Coregonus sp. 'balchen']|nr:unnamed protein product [Coregonus sp. 'balchen']
MSRAHQPPLVTGISPNEGTSWTKVTIRGENLGTGPADLVGLSICGHNCLLTAEWMSASKIVCHVGPAKDDKGEIIVSTKSGGHGTSTVSFKLLKAEKIGILDQSAVGKVPLKDLEAMFPGLRMAASNLKKQATKKNEGSLAYVKGGLSTFFEAQDALAVGSRKLSGGCLCLFLRSCIPIHQRLESDGTEKVEGSMTQRLENVLNRLKVNKPPIRTLLSSPQRHSPRQTCGPTAESSATAHLHNSLHVGLQPESNPAPPTATTCLPTGGPTQPYPDPHLPSHRTPPRPKTPIFVPYTSLTSTTAHHPPVKHSTR